MRRIHWFILALLCVNLSLFPSTTKRVFAKYKNKVFIETGSLVGDGIQNALDAGYQHVYSIELSEKYYNICQNRFSHNPRVHLVLGDSAKMLTQLLNQINEPITFWLDGHFMQHDTAKGETMTPLLKELEAIKNHPIKTHTILIDDVRLFGTWEFDEIPLKGVFDKLKEINPKYTFVYEDGHVKNDVLVALIPKD